MIQLNVTALTAPYCCGPSWLPSSAPMASSSTLLPSLLSGAGNCSTGTYSGTKAYVVNLTQSLHHEVGNKGIQVPGPSSLVPPALSSGIAPGLAVHHLPEQTVMSAEEMVDASLAGLDQQELITIPSFTEPRGLAEVRRCPPRSRSQPLAQAGGQIVIGSTAYARAELFESSIAAI